jgi:hypothetical protein
MVSNMLSTTLEVTQLGNGSVVVSIKTLQFFSHDGSASLTELIKDEFELPFDARLKFCFEEMPNDPDDPCVYRTITLAAIVGCLKAYLVSEDPLKLWRPPEYGKPLLAFTVIAAPPAPWCWPAAAAPLPSTPGLAVSALTRGSNSAAAHSVAAGSAGQATPGSAQTAPANKARNCSLSSCR